MLGTGRPALGFEGSHGHCYNSTWTRQGHTVQYPALCHWRREAVTMPVKVDKHLPLLSSPRHSPVSSRQESNTFQTSSSQPQLEIVASFQGRDHSFASKCSSACGVCQCQLRLPNGLPSSWASQRQLDSRRGKQSNTQRRWKRWNVKRTTNFSRVFNSSAAKICSNVSLAWWLAFSAAVSHVRFQSTLTLNYVYFILYIRLFLPLYASENLGFETKGRETPSDCFAFF